MRTIGLLSICLLTALCCCSQPTLIQPEKLLIENGDTSVVIPYLRAKILFQAVAVLNERIRLDERRIENLEQTKVELKQALALCENIVSNNKKVVSDYEGIIRNNKKKARNRIFYFGSGGLAVGLLTGLIIAR